MPNDSISLLPIPFQYRFVVRFLFKTEFPLTVQPIKNHAHNAPYVDIKNNQTRAFDIQALQSMGKALFPRAHLLICFQFAGTYFCFKFSTIKTEFGVQTSQSMVKALFSKAHLLIFSQFAGTYFCFKLCLIKTEFSVQTLQSMVKALFPRAHLLICFQFAETHFCFKFSTIKTELSVQASQSMVKALFPKAHLLIFFQFAGTHFGFKFSTIKTEFGVQASQSMGKALFPRAHLLIFSQFAETYFCFKFNTIKTEPSVHREPAKGGKAFIIQRIPFAFSPSSEIYFLLKRTLCNFCPMPRINGRQRFDAAYADQTACISAGKCKVFHPFQFTPQKVNRLLCSCDLFLRFRPFHRQKSSAHL